LLGLSKARFTFEGGPYTLTVPKGSHKISTICDIDLTKDHHASVKAAKGGGTYSVEVTVIPNNKNWKPHSGMLKGYYDKKWTMADLHAGKEQKLTAEAKTHGDAKKCCIRATITCDGPPAGKSLCTAKLTKLKMGIKSRRLLEPNQLHELEWSDALYDGDGLMQKSEEVSADKPTVGVWMSQHATTAMALPIALVSAISLASLIVKRARRNPANCEAELLAAPQELTEMDQ